MAAHENPPMRPRPPPSYFDKIAAGGFANLIYVPAGFPDPKRFVESIIEISQHEEVDAIEVGIPFSDPIADGPVIEEAYRVALVEHKIGSVRQVVELLQEAVK